MAKRQRGGTRPGQRPPQRAATRPVTRPAVPIRTASLTDDDLDRAAALEAEIVEEERTAAASLARGRERKRVTGADNVTVARGRTRASGTLAVVAADEYRYVARDLRRIVMMFALIFGLLVVSFLVLIVGGIVK